MRVSTESLPDVGLILDAPLRAYAARLRANGMAKCRGLVGHGIAALCLTMTRQGLPDAPMLVREGHQVVATVESIHATAARAHAAKRGH